MKRFSSTLRTSACCLLAGLAFTAGAGRAQDLNFSRLAGSWLTNGNGNLSAVGSYYRPRGLITAAGTAVRSGNQVASVTITNSGVGYTSPPTVTFSGGGGSGAVGVAVLSATGSVVSVTIVNGGSDYTSNPTVTFSAPLLGGVGSTGIFNTDITVNPRLLTVDGNYTYGRMILGDLGGGEAYSFEVGTGGRFTFDNGIYAGGHAFLNKFQGGADLIKTPLTIDSNLIARVQSNRITVSNTLSGTGVLTSTGNGVLAITGNNTGNGMDLVLWNRSSNNTGPQVELGSGTGHAVSGDITVGNALRGTAGHAVLQLLQGRSNLDQINDGSTLIFDSINGVGRNAYFKLMGGSETVGRILDLGDRAVIENRESEGVGTSAILTIGSNTTAGNLNSRIDGFLRDASGSNVQQGDSNAKVGSGVTSQLGITKQGNGDLRLVGANIIYSGNTLIANGSLTLQNTTNFRSNITNNSQLNFDVTGTLNMRKVFPTIPGSDPSRSYADEYLSVSGTGSVNKTGNGTLGLFGTQNIGGTFSMDNGTVNLNANATGISIGGALVGTGDPGLNRNINLRGVVNIGGGIDFGGRFVNTGSTLTIGGAALGFGDQDSASWVDTAVNVTGSIRLNHANLLLESDYSIGKTSSGGTTNSQTVTITNSADLLVGMRVSGNGVPANTTVTAIDTVRRIVTLSNNASIPASTPLTFRYSTNTDGRIVGSPTDITISGRPNLVGAGDSGSRLILSNTEFSNNTNRLPDATPIVSNGGVMEFMNNGSTVAGANFSETVGNLVLNPGAFQVIGYRAAASRTSTLTFAGLQRNAGSILEFGGRDLSSGAPVLDTNNLGVDTRNRIFFTTAPTLTNGILGGWAYANNEWVTYGANGVTRLTTYNTSANAEWKGVANVKMATGQTFTAAGERSLNSLNIQPDITAGAAGLTLNLNTSPLYITSGGLLSNHGNHAITSGSTSGFLTAGTSVPGERELFAIVGNTANSTGLNILTVNASIRDFVISRNINLTSAGLSSLTLQTGFSTNELSVGMAVSGPGIAPGTTITAISGNQLTLSQATTGLMGAGTALSFGATQRVSLVKGGAGTLRLNDIANAFTGRTVVTNGTLMLGGEGVLGPAPASFVADQVRLDGGFLQFARRTAGTGATDDTRKDIITGFAPDKFFDFSEGNRGFTIGSSGGRFEVGLNDRNPGVSINATSAEPEVHVTITNPIFAEGLLELAVRASPGLDQYNTLTLGDASSTNQFLGGLKTEGSFEGIVTVHGDNEIGGLLVEGGEFNLTGDNDFTSGIRMTSGDLTLSGANTFRGGQTFPTINLPTGTLRLENAAALGTGGLSLALAGSGQVQLTGINQTIREISTSANSSALITNTAATPATVTFALDNNQTYSGQLSNGGAGLLNLTKTGPGRLQLTNSQSGFSGVIRIEEGVIDVRTMGFAGSISSLGTGGNGSASQLVLAGGVLSFTPLTQLTTNRTFTLGAGSEAGTLVANGNTRAARVVLGAELDSVVSQPIGFEGSGPRTLSLGGTNVGLNTLALELGDAAPGDPTALMKIGSGVWLLGAASSYSGQTTLIDGVLRIDANYAAGTTSIPTTASAAANTLAGNLPNGVMVTLPKFKGNTLPGGLVAGQRYYVVGSNGSSFQLAATPGGAAIDLTSDGANVSFVPNIQGVASTSVVSFSGTGLNTDRFTGNLPNGTPVSFGTRAVYDPTGATSLVTPGLPNANGGALVHNATYYVINSNGTSFQISRTPGGAAVDLTSAGTNVFYSAAVTGNNSEGIYVMGGRLDIGNVDYTAPETLIFQGGGLGVPRGLQATWAGNVDMQANASWTINAGSTLTLTGNILGNRTITQLGEGTVVLKGEALNFTPPDGLTNQMDNTRRTYTLQAGTLVLDYSVNNNSKLTDSATFVMGGGRRGGILRLQNGSHEEIVNALSLQAGASQIYRDGGASVVRLNNIVRQTGASLYFDQERIAKVDNANLNGILGGWAIIRDARQDAYLVIPGTVSRTFTADPATATLTTPLNEAVHYLVAGVPVRFTTTGELPAGLAPDTTYYAIDTTARSFRVSATPFGEAVQIASTGTGVHTVETYGAQRRPGPASLVFTVDPRAKTNAGVSLAGAAGNNTIRVRIAHNAGSFGPITFGFSGSGTTAVPWSFTINTTGAASSASEIADALSIYSNAIGRIKVVSSGFDFSPDSTVYPASPATWLLLDGGVDDTGRQSLSWARNGSTVPGNFNDGPVESANDFQTNLWSSGFNTDVISSGTPINIADGASTYTLRFANALAATINLQGTLGHTLQTGAILVSPTVGRNDSILTGTSTLTTDNEGFLQNFLIHQYNELGDLVLGVPLVDRQPFTRGGYLSAPNTAGSEQMRRITGLVGLDGTGDTSQLSVGMTVTGTSAPGGATIVAIPDNRTVIISADFTGSDNSRNIYTFDGVIQMRGSIRQSAQNRITGVVNAQGQLATSDLYIGMPISGPGIPPGYRVQSIVNESDISIGTLNGNGITVDTNNHVYNGMQTQMTFTPAIGLEKLGPGTLVVSGDSSYSGITYLGNGSLRANKLTDGGVPGSLGASSNANGNLTFNGGVLQYVGPNSTTNRGLTLFDYAEINVGHELTTSVFNGSISGADIFAKSGSGTLEMRGNAGLAEIRVLEGRLRVQTTDLNNSPATYSQSNFGQTGLGELRLAGGAFELRGTSFGNSTLTLGGQLYVDAGASEVRAVGVNGINPNNLNAGTLPRTTQLSLMGQEEITNVERSAAGSVLFVEDPLVGGAVANILLNVEESARGRILPWAVYQDTTNIAQPGVNNFAAISLTTGAVVSADSQSQHDLGDGFMNANSWGTGSPSFSLDVSEGGQVEVSFSVGVQSTAGSNVLEVSEFLSFQFNNLVPDMSVFGPGIPSNTKIVSLLTSPLRIVLSQNATSTNPNETNPSATYTFRRPRAYFGTLTANRAVNTLRYFSSADSQINVPAGNTLQLLSGAILVAANVRGGEKSILGEGSLSGAVGSEQSDLIIHNYNPVTPFTIGTRVTDNILSLVNSGTISAGSNSLRVLNAGVSTLVRLRVGMSVSGPGIQPGTTISSIDEDNRRVYLSAPSLSSQTAQTFSFTAATSFVQTGTGTTVLAGNNDYNGTTHVHGGVLRLDSANAVPGGIGAVGGTSNLLVKGGVVGLGHGDFTRAGGTGTAQIQFQGSGGFAAYGADRTVNLGGKEVPDILRYGNNGFVPDGSSFLLGAGDATHKTLVLNPIDLGSFSQAVRVIDGPASIEGDLAGGLIGLGKLIKFGTGSLRLSGSSSHTGGIEIAAGRLVVANVPNALGTGAGPVVLGSDLTHTAKNAAIEMVVEGGTLTKDLQVGSVNSRGADWILRGSVDTSGDLVGTQASTAVINNHPAIAYYDSTSGDLKYVRAADPRGTSWLPPVTVASRGDVGQFPSLAIVNGNPAISYYDATNKLLMFVRSTDISGVFWGNPIVVDSSPVSAIAVQSDGKIIIGGVFVEFDGQVRQRLARLNPDGSLDASFSPRFNGTVNAIAIQSDDEILVAGAFTEVNDIARGRMARLNADGSLDTSYNPNFNGTVRGLLIEPDERVLVWGSFTGTNRNRVARLNADGTPDSGFNANANNEVRAVARQSDGSLVLGGTFTQVGGVDRNRMARVSSTGVLDGSFNPNLNNAVSALLIQPDDKILIGGVFSTVNNGARRRDRLARLNSNGSIDESFFLDANGEVSGFLRQADGEILLHGAFTRIGITPRFNLARLNTDDTLDAGFNPEANDEVLSVAQLTGGQLLVGGSFSNIGGGTRHFLARLTLDGQGDVTFNRQTLDRGRYSSLTQVRQAVAFNAGEERPAIAYYDVAGGLLRYTRAVDVNGANWNPPLILDASANVGTAISLRMVNIGGDVITKNTANSTVTISGIAINGTPAVAYYDATNGDLKYVLSNDPAGTDWSSPVTVHSSGDVGSHLSLAVVDGRPAIAYYDAGAGLRYVRATSPGGLTSNLRDLNGNILTTGINALAYTNNWGAPVLVDGGQVGTFASLDIITDSTTAQGRPAIAYYDAAGLNLKYVRAQNVTGSAWGTPRTVVSIGDVGRSAGLVLTDGVPGIAYHDATAGDLKFLHLADATGYSRLSLADGTDWQGGVTIDGDLFFNVGADALATVSGAIQGAAGIKVSGSGTLRLTNAANNFGATLPGPATTINSAVIVRSGTLALAVNGAIGTATVELGDALPQILTVDRATTFESLTARAGRFDADHNGFFDNAGGPGAFVDVDTTIDGFTYRPETLPPEPVLILVKDERDNPQWNGVYQIIFNGDQQPDATMNLVRVAAMDTAAELAYGTQVRVLNGTHAGSSFFIASQVDEVNASAVNWVRDVADASAALLAEVAGLNISNAIDINGNPLSIGDGSRGVLGGLASLTAGNVQFSGGVLLQNRRSGVREERNVDLQSFTNTGYGVSFTGVFAESDSGTGATQDRLNLRKTGSGTATLTAANTFRGTVTVAEGTLLAMNNAGSATGLGTVTVNAGAVLGGTGFLGGPVNLAGAAGVQAILRPGDPTATLAVEALTLSGALTVGADSVVEFAAGAASLTRLIANSVAVTGTGRFLLSLLEDYTPAVDTVFDLVDGTINLPAGANLRDHLVLPGDLRWDTSTFVSEGTIRVLGATVPVAIATQPAITTPAGGGSVNPGSNVTVTFTATVSGSPEFRYQWQKSPVGMNTWTQVGAPFYSTSNTATLTLTGILEADEADYRLVAVNGSLIVEDANTFTATSLPVTLVVNDPPTITQQPASVAVNPGETAVLSVTATGPGPISYQWRRGTTNLTPPTVGLSTFEIPNVQKSQEGSNYNVLVSNGASVIAGPTQSNFFSLTVRDPVAITNFPATTGVAEGDPIVLNLGHVGTGTPDLPAPGDPAFVYTWERDNGAGFAPIPGAPNAAQITLPAATPADNGAVIRVTVANSFSSAQATTTIAVVNPSVRNQPDSRTVLAGTAFTLEIEAGGSTEGLTYQWKRGKSNLKEGSGIRGVNTPVLQFDAVTLKQSGDYSCEVINAFGTRLSDPAYVTVVDAPGGIVPVQTGKNITLTLSFSAPKGVSVRLKWQKDGADLPADLRYSADNQSKFTISTTNGDDSGIYTCLVTGPGPGPEFNQQVAGGNFDLRVFSDEPVLALEPFPPAMVGAWFEYQIEVDPDPARAPTSYSAKPLPSGLKLDTKTGKITGIPKSPVTDMQVTLGAGNAYNKSVTEVLPITVQAVPAQAVGTFLGWIPRHEELNQFMGGRFDLTVASAGTFSGRLTLGATTYSYKGTLVVDPTNASFPEATVSIPRKGKPTPPPLTLSFRIDTTANRLDAGSISGDGHEVEFGDNTWRNSWNATTQPATGYNAYHTLALLPPGHPTPDPATPEGTGYASFTAAADGRLTFAGRTGDGQTVSCASFVGPSGQIVVFQALYKSTPRGSLLGHLQLTRNVPSELSDNKISGSLTWNCPPNTNKNYLYPEGFGNSDASLFTVTALGGHYAPPQAPTEANPDPDLILGVKAGNDNALLTFVHGGVEPSDTNPNLDGPAADPAAPNRGWVSINAGSKIVLPKGKDANPGTTSLKVTTSNGLVSGKFTLEDISESNGKLEKRSVSYFGILVDEDDGALGYLQVGTGYYQLRQHPNQYPESDPPLTLKTTPIRAGALIFEARPE